MVRAILHCSGHYRDVTRTVSLPSHLAARVSPLVPPPYDSGLVPFRLSFWSRLLSLCEDDASRYALRDFCDTGRDLYLSGRHPQVWIDLF